MTHKLSGKISSGMPNHNGKITAGSGFTDHSRLINKDLENQHPIEAITDLRTELDSKLNSKTAMPLIEEALKGKAKGLYFDAMKEFARKSYWYLTSEIDPITKIGTKESIISGPYDLGMGGGSGGGSGVGGVTTVTVRPYNWPSAATVGGTTKLKVQWSSTIGEDKAPTGNGTLYLTVNNKQVEVRANCEQGLVEFDVSKYLVAGSNNIQVKVLDMYGTTGLTISALNAVTLKLESKFDGNKAYQGEINYTYIPIGDVEKTVFFYVDDELHGQQVVTATNETQTYVIKNLRHGAHTLRVYFEAWVGSDSVTSNELFYELIYFVPGNETPIIASTFTALEQEQYISFNIPYRVYIYGLNTFPVTLWVNGEEESSFAVNSSVQYWTYHNDTPGNYTLAISCGGVSKSFNIHISESTIQVTPITSGLALALNAQGRTNADTKDLKREDWKFTDSNGVTYACELTNFNWSSDGWLLDGAEGDTNRNSILRVGGDARVRIPFQIFANDFKTNGKTIEFELATRSIRDYDTTIISCSDNKVTPFFSVEAYIINEEFRKKGFKVNYTYSTLENLSNLGLLAVGTHLFTYNGTSWTLDGAVVNLDDFGLFIQEKTLSPEGTDTSSVIEGDQISLTYSLEARGIKVTPQLATIRSQQSVLSTQYKEDEHIRIAFVVEQTAENRIIWMYLNGVASGAMQYPVDDVFKQLEPSDIYIGSNDAIVDIYNIRIYNNSLTNKQVVTNWIADTQDAGLRAERWEHNDVLDDANAFIVSKVPEDLPYMIWDIDPLPQAKGDKRRGNVRYVDASLPERNFTAENAEYNVQGTSSAVYPVKNIRIKYSKASAWYDDNGDTVSKFPITYPGGIGEDYFTYKVDYASSEGANNVELVRLYNDASLKYGIYTPPQRQDAKVRVGIDGFPIVAFQQDKDGNVKFVTKANFNNDKANPSTYGFTEGDESWEITNNSAAETKFQVPATIDTFSRGFEIRFPDEDGYNNMSKLEPMTRWLVSTYRAEATNAAFDTPVTFTYEETTKAEDGSFSKTTVSKTFDADTVDYRLAKFKAELANWFNVDSSLFYYLFTTLFLMIDSRAKNAFPTYFASREAGDGGDRWFWIPYDMDTAIGIDNKGKLTFDYYLEDTDRLNNADVYNGQDSVMWSNIRDAFPGELAEMYATLRTQGLIDYNYVEQMFEDHQSKWPETVLNIDSYNKYVLPLKNGDNYLEMLQGTKTEQRKWWLYNRFKYIDSKYNAGDAKADFVQFRAYVGAGEKKPNITVTPYANIYATVSYGNGAQHTVVKRALNRNEPIVLENTFSTADEENDQETYIYSASQLKSIGDISPFKPDTVKVGNAIRLQELKVGDGADDYENPHLTELTLGANTLLKKIDARNCTNLGTGTTVAPDLQECTNIEEVYFEGTKIKGINLPDGGILKKLHLPGTLVSLTIKNQPLLTDLQIADTNTTITRMLSDTAGYNFCGIVKQKEPWSDLSANGNIYVADSLDANAAQIRVSIADQEIFDQIIEQETYLSITCKTLSVRFDLIDETVVELVEYAAGYLQNLEILDLPTANTSELLRSIKPSIIVPTVEEFKISLLETLWLEGIPSSAIKARSLVERMRPGMEVRLIGIDEAFESWEALENFYKILNTHHGINFSDEATPPKAQVTGIVHIPIIPYAKYVELHNQYPEVNIDAKHIICSVTFKNGDDTHMYQNIYQGSYAVLPEVPIKSETQKNYYTFNSWIDDEGKTWTEDCVITRDITIRAVYDEYVQQYTARFNTDSNIIGIDEASQTVYWGESLIEPKLSNIPEDVYLVGWFSDGNPNPWKFAGAEQPTPLYENTELMAIWHDDKLPFLHIYRKNYNTIQVVAHDNLGISAYGLVHNSTEAPTTWTNVTTATDLTFEQTITAAGDWYVWVADKNGNTKHEKVIAHAIQYDNTPGIAEVKILEDGQQLHDFALNGTQAICTVSLDSHYYDLKIDVNGIPFDNGNIIGFEHSITVKSSCTPKDYTVTFVTGKEMIPGSNMSIKEPDQTITYLHAVAHPASQYYVGEVIEAWYTNLEDESSKWIFDGFENATQVTGDTTLYAKWVEYRTPTKITIKLETDGELIGVDYTQRVANSVLVDWGDVGEDLTPDANPEKFSSSPETLYVAKLEHIYAKAGTYVIKIWGTKYGYNIGNGYSRQVVNPASVITAVDFAWDLANTADYAFLGANITELNLTSYMKEVSIGAFAACTQLKSLRIPKNIMILRDQAFSDCSGIEGTVVFPNSIIQVGNSVFYRCSSIENFVFEDSLKLTSLGKNFCDGCKSIKKIDLPAEITKLNQYAFANMSSLEKIVLRNPNLVMDTFVFAGDPKLLSAGPIDWSNPGGSEQYNIEFAWNKHIPGYAFYQSNNARYLRYVTLPEGIESIGIEAFGDTNLMSINFPTTLKSIGAKAFYHTSLSSIVIPETVSDIGAQAFSYCYSLSDVTIRTRWSDTKAAVPEQGWFYMSNTKLKPKVSEVLTEVPEDDLLAINFGRYWNAYSYNAETDKTTYLLVSTFKEEIE